MHQAYSSDHRSPESPSFSVCAEQPPHRFSWYRITWLALAGSGWVTACVLGSYIAMRYDFEPGALGRSPVRWPADTVLQRQAGQLTVLAFVHPRCVCTAASVKNLLETLREQPDAHLIAVLFVPADPGAAKDWQNLEYEQTIRARVPAARIIADPGGREAVRFGAITSGTILVYDTQGTEIFRGGITDRRGGDEDNPGLRQFARALASGRPEPGQEPPPVYGCALQAPADPSPAHRSNAP